MIYIRRIGEIPDGAITEIKIADNAVSSAKIQDSAILESKIDDLAISTQKLKDQAVSLAKAQQAIKIHHFVGDETEVNVVGVTEGDVKFLTVPRATSINSGIRAQKLHLNAEIKVTGAIGAQGTLKVYIDNEQTPRITVNTTSDTYEMQEANTDISDLSNGKHSVKVTMLADNAEATVWNDLIEIFLEK